MNKPAGTSQAALLLAGFLVLAMPLAFFNNLLSAAMERTRESAAGLLREEVLQAAEQIRTQFKPATYVKEVIRKIHQRLLPEITPDLTRMFPEKGFGKSQFSASLPEKILQALRDEGLDAIQIIVFPPEYENAFFWHCNDLKKQCPDEPGLVKEQTVNHYESATRLYNQHYQKPWPKLFTPPDFLRQALGNLRNDKCFAYLNRFSEIISSHDRVNEYFTDYFGQQSFFSYSYQCFSPVTLHGGYSIIVPQNSIKPGAVVKAALKNNQNQTHIRLIDLQHQEEGFREFEDRIEYYTRPPSDFWSHYFFITGDRTQAQKSRHGGWHIKISGYFPRAITDQKRQFKMFRLLAISFLMLYGAFALRIGLFGFQTGGSARKKLALILGLIIILPTAGTGTMVWMALKGSDRIIETNLLEETLNWLREVSVMNDENLLRQMVAVLEVKRRLERSDVRDQDLKKSLAMPGDDLKWYSTWTNSLNTAYDSGELLQYNTWQEIISPNRLVNSLVSKYIDSMGLVRLETNARKNELSRTMTLGLMENYITPDIEEAWMVHESTIQREVSHSADVSRAAIYLVRNRSGHYQLLFQRVCNNDEHIHRYLTWLRNNEPGWFSRNGKYGDLELGVRLRKYSDLFLFAWPPRALLDEKMTACFEKALSSKDTGYGITRKDRQLDIRAWRYKDGEAALISAICRGKGSGLAGLATFMTIPLLLGYAALVLYFITAIIAAFVSEPIKIINAGVDALKNENYGVLIAGFSGDEFKQMTQAFNEMSNALRQREMIKRYVSGRLIQQVQTSGSHEPSAAGQLVRITALASDIRGFTSISEKYGPAEVVEMLNSYFTLMESAITLNGGIIDKYVGDAVQAIFYHDGHQENAALRACKAAAGMRQQLKIFNSERMTHGLFTVENGIGLATGMAISGSIGGERGRKDFTVVGNVMEKAAMIEARTPESSSRILICRETGQEVAATLSIKDFDAETTELIDV